MTLTDPDVKKAERRLQVRLKAQPRAVSARYDRHEARFHVPRVLGLTDDPPYLPPWLGC
jgi:hypothetical protein